MSSKNSNTYRESTQSRWLRLLIAAVVLGCAAPTIYGIDPNRDLSHYIHDKWGTDRGFPGGQVYAITQTGDGYLWIATEKGLVRFDGLTFRLYQHANTSNLPAGPVLGLATDNEGKLWIRFRGASIVRYDGGKFEDVSRNLVAGEPGITAMGSGTNGEILLSGLASGTLRYSGGNFLKLAPPPQLPNFLVISLVQGTDGKLWLGTRDLGLYSLSQGQISETGKGLPDQKINCLLPINNQELWIGTDNGVVRWNGAGISNTGVASSLSHVQARTMISDRDANVWVGTAGGLFRINAQGTVGPLESGGRSAGAVTALFEDREGNIWAGTSQGIERLRESVFVTYSIAEGMPALGNGPIYVAAENRAWFGPAGGGLYWFKAGQAERVTDAGLNLDVVYSITGGSDELWVGRQKGGLTHLHAKGSSSTSATYTQAQGLAQNSVYSVQRNRDGTVWAGTLSGGVSRFSGGKFTTYTNDNGLASNTVDAILEGSHDTMWFATPNGLSALSKNNWRTFLPSDGLPSERVNCLTEDPAGVLWVGTDNGLAFFHENRFHVPAGRPSSLHEPIFGVVADEVGSLWIATANHVLRASRDALMRGELGDADVREYGQADGLHGSEGVKRNRSVTIDPQGLIWFSLSSGISVVDPKRAARASVPALVHVNAMAADGSPVDLLHPIRIPSASQRISFSFAGLSLAIPERVKFRYLLEGINHAWSEPNATGEAIYTNLGPGSYRFRVMASNSDGVWNSAEDAIAFEISPAFWQTWWFRMCAVLAFCLMVLALYRYRLHQLTSQLNLRFEERLTERTLIAQELHDTLLQGFLSASMQLDVAVDQLPVDSPMRSRLGSVLELMRQVIEEGRNALRGLRSTNPKGSLDLEQSFSRLQQELGATEEIGFRVVVEGSSCPLRPIVRDEVYRIGREGVANAFRHARARNIEVDVAYLTNYLRVLVRDDGCGIDPEVLQSGREGHWGLSGMRERADRIEGRLKVLSRVGSGTEVELLVPSHVAFQKQPAAGPLGWFAKLSGRRLARDVAKRNGEER